MAVARMPLLRMVISHSLPDAASLRLAGAKDFRYPDVRG
jgi:hypothetical protein